MCARVLAQTWTLQVDQLHHEKLSNTQGPAAKPDLEPDLEPGSRLTSVKRENERGGSLPRGLPGEVSSAYLSLVWVSLARTPVFPSLLLFLSSGGSAPPSS